MLLRSLKTSIPRKQQDGTLFHPKLSKWARLSSLHLYVIFMTVVSRAAKLPTLYTRRLQDIVILMYKIKNGLCPNYLYRLFIFRRNQYHLRNNDFVVPRVNTTGYGKHSVRYLGPVLWSKIDRKFRELKTLYEFKRKIRMVDLAKHILANNCINCTLCYS